MSPSGHRLSGIDESPTYVSFQATERAVVPYPHRLPKRLTWAIHLTTAVGMVILNVLQIFIIKTLVLGKFDCVQWVIDAYGFWAGVILLMVLSMLFALCCLGVIFGLAPAAAGSGSPENKGWLNGSQDTAGIFTWRNMAVRATATVFSNASGFPVGREGPTVTMGSNLAFCITDRVSSWYVRRWIRAMTSAERAAAVGSDEDIAAAVLEQDRFQAAKRRACVVGGACGMAMIFDSPIGGIVYMFEEIGATSWGADLTFSAFSATVACDVLMRLGLERLGSDIKDWVIFQVDFDTLIFDSATWTWSDVPLFVGLALVLGPFSALHTHMCLAISTYRQRFLKRLQRQTLGKILDGVLFAALCALVATFVASLGGCNATDPDAKELDGLEFVRFTCPGESFYNPVASLLVTTSEAAMKLLISRDGDFFDVKDLVLAFLAYTSLNITLTGIPVPSGNFTGTMLIGGLVGRALGIKVQTWWPDSEMAKPGVYAMMGSAAMLCGFKRMSMAVVLFIAECGDDWDLIPPLMMCVWASLAVNHIFLKNGFDEEQMMRKGIHFLHPEPEKCLYGHVASFFIDESRVAIPPQVDVDTARRLLEGCSSHDCLPVVGADNICVGFTTPMRLRSALATFEGGGAASPAAQAPTSRPTRPGGDMAEELVSSAPAPPTSGKLNLELIVDRSPYKVDEDMPAPRVYALFAKAGIAYACVVSRRGEFRGVVTRTSLSRATRRLHAQAHS